MSVDLSLGLNRGKHGLKDEHISVPTVLSVTDLDVAYGETAVLSDVSFSTRAADGVCLLGPNGAGKTTLIRTILGRVTPKRGTIDVPSKDIGLVPQEIALFPKLTIIENLEVFARLAGVPRRQVSARARDLSGSTGLDAHATTRVEDLSGGWQRRVNIASALISEPKLLILDEPTVGVDAKARDSLHDLILSLRDNGLGVLLTTHDFAEAERLSSHLLLLVGGRIAHQGRIDDLVDQQFGTYQNVVIRLRRTLSERDAQAFPAFHAIESRRALAGLVPHDYDWTRVTDALNATGADIDGVRVERPTLGDLYAALVGEPT